MSTTYILDLKYLVNKTEEAEKSIFVKVPLTGPAAQNFKSVNKIKLIIKRPRVLLLAVAGGKYSLPAFNFISPYA